MNHHPNQPLVSTARPWRVALWIGAGAMAAAAMLGFTEAGDAHADTSSDVLGQAGADLAQATQVLDAAPTASLGAEQATLLAEQESLQSDSAATLLSSQESLQSGLPVADQSFLTGVDDQLTQAYQGLLNADQAFVVADQAGDLSSATGLVPADFGVIDADFSLLGADVNTVFADVGAEFANLFDLSALLP
jgi:hypothetical protein